MKKTIIFGIGLLAENMYEYLTNDDRYEVAGFTVNREYMTDSHFMGKAVVPFENITEIWSTDEYKVLVAIGYTKMNRIREQMVMQVKSKGYEIADYIHPTATILTDDIGEGNIILELVSICPAVKIGSGNLMYPNVKIAHNVKIGNFNHFSGCMIGGTAVIGNFCFFGMNCTVKNGVHISDFTLVGATSYVANDSHENDVFMPPRTRKINVKDNYEFLS